MAKLHMIFLLTRANTNFIIVPFYELSNVFLVLNRILITDIKLKGYGFTEIERVISTDVQL